MCSDTALEVPDIPSHGAMLYSMFNGGLGMQLEVLQLVVSFNLGQ